MEEIIMNNEVMEEAAEVIPTVETALDVVAPEITESINPRKRSNKTAKKVVTAVAAFTVIGLVTRKPRKAIGRAIKGRVKGWIKDIVTEVINEGKKSEIPADAMETTKPDDPIDPILDDVITEEED